MQQIATDEQLRLKLKSLSRQRAELFSWEKTSLIPISLTRLFNSSTVQTTAVFLAILSLISAIVLMIKIGKMGG